LLTGQRIGADIADLSSLVPQLKPKKKKKKKLVQNQQPQEALEKQLA